MAWETLSEAGVEGWRTEEGEAVEKVEVESVRQAEGGWPAVEVAEKGMWGRQGLEAGSSPVAPLVEVVERGGRGEEVGSERERRMRREMEAQTEARELPALEESQGGELEKKRRRSISDSVNRRNYLNIFFTKEMEIFNLKRKLYHQDWVH